MKQDRAPLVRRYSGNPILTRDHVPYPVATVHNAGIVKHNGRYIMLFRSHLHNGRSIIGRADSTDGFSVNTTGHSFNFQLPGEWLTGDPARIQVNSANTA